MSLVAACGWTLLRSLLVALVVIPLCWTVRRQAASLTGHARTLLWTLLLVPVLTPALLTGYGYSSFSLSLIRHPQWNEALYATLMGLRFLAVGVLVMHFAPPPPISAAALHCAKLALHATGSRLGRIRALWPYYIRGPWRAAFPTAAVLFLLVFQEFETASLMGVASWTVWLFDAQAGGLVLGRSLRSALLPGGCELLVLSVLLAFAWRSQFLPSAPEARQTRPAAWLACLVWVVAGCACAAVLGIPLLIAGRGAVSGLIVVLRNRQMLHEILVALGFGLGAGIPAALAAALMLKALRAPNQPAGRRPPVVLGGFCLALSLPGMLGSLLISLALLWLFQSPVLNSAYNTPLPAAVALFLFLLPRALLLQLLFESATPQQSVHAARLLQAAPDGARRTDAVELLWRLRYRRHFLAAGLLSIWGYFELTPASILAPPGLTSAPVRLYNFMHYGRSMALSAMVLLAMLAPVSLFLLAGLVRKPLLSVLARLVVPRRRRAGEQ